jgi:hypothetical protein
MFSLMRSAYAFARIEDESFGVREALRAATVDSAAAAPGRSTRSSSAGAS